MMYAVRGLVDILLLPPLSLVVLAALGFALLRRHPRLGRSLMLAAFVLLWIFTAPAFIYPAFERLNWPAAVEPGELRAAQAIVVLGGGRQRGAVEYGELDTVGWYTLARVRYGAFLARRTGLPILVSGGRAPGTPASRPTEAEMMKAVLEREFHAPVRWVEARSRDTFENADYSARILREAGIARVLLVTHAFHMRRSVEAFAAAGIEVIAAPTGLATDQDFDVFSFLPSPAGLQACHLFAHEVLGRAWYAIRRRLD